MRNFSEMDKHYDRHNEGICMICGCTTERWKSVCDACRYEAVKEENQTSLEAEIAQLQTDNRSLVEQMNQMALKPNQEVIDWHSYIEKKPEKTGYYIIYYTILNRVAFDFWHNDKQEWDKYGEYILAWAYLPKGAKHE